MVYSGIKCDKCGAMLQNSTFVGTVLTRKWEREDGWSVGKQDLCPVCRKEK